MSTIMCDHDMRHFLRYHSFHTLDTSQLPLGITGSFHTVYSYLPVGKTSSTHWAQLLAC